MNSGKLMQLVALLLLVVIGAGASLQPITKNIKLGLDLQGGIHVVMQAVETPGRPVTQETMEKVQEIMRKRIDAFGVEEPVLQISGKDRLIIELAGVKDPNEVMQRIGQTALLTFRDESGKVVLEADKHLASAKAEYIPGTQEPEILLEFTPEGTKIFADVTTANVGRKIGIYLDEDLISNPVVKVPITNGKATISGGFKDLKEAHEQALILSYGALPVKMKEVEKRTVGPTLGADSLAKSKTAIVIGLALIALFMMAYYRLPGLLALFSLVTYSAIVLGVMVYMKATLTLPGIAGFLLSIGMAVDLNIIVYERIKEEIRGGKTLRSAVDAGFKRGFATILDANVTTLISSAVLYYFGTGPVKGFAVTLALGVLVSLFTAVTLTRWMLRLTVESNITRNPKVYGV